MRSFSLIRASLSVIELVDVLHKMAERNSETTYKKCSAYLDLFKVRSHTKNVSGLRIEAEVGNH